MSNFDYWVARKHALASYQVSFKVIKPDRNGNLHVKNCHDCIILCLFVSECDPTSDQWQVADVA
jgi:hypothetical protein